MKVLVISDLHIGSTYSLIPKGFITSEGYEVKPNKAQQWLAKCWEDFQMWIDGNIGADPFALVINGDLIEGIHHGTKEIWSNEIEDQIEAAAMIITPLARRAKKVFLVDGTECHTGGHEHRIGREIGAQVNPDTKRCTFPRLYLQAGKHTLVFKHHIGTSTREWTGASAYSNHLAEERLQAAMHGHPLPDVLACAHRHKFGHWEDSHGHCVVTPPWQMGTRYARKVVPNPLVRPGGVLIDTSGPRVDLQHITYDAMPVKPVKL